MSRPSRWLCLIVIVACLPRASALCSVSPPTKLGRLEGRDYGTPLREKIAGSIAKGERRARERSAELRQVCSQCARPDTLCVCDSLPDEGKLATQTRILILQHPNERRKKNLSTVPLLRLALQNVQVTVGYTFEPESLPIVQEELDQGRKPLLLYPSEDAIALDEAVDATSTSGSRSTSPSPSEAIKGQDNLLIIMDGTWTEAKRMVRDSPRLVESCQKVQFTSDASSIYDALRSEPAPHCLSTLEACARVLLLLEPGCDRVQESLHKVLQAHVDAHLENAKIMAPRFVGATRHQQMDKRKRRREIESTLFAPNQLPEQEIAPFVWQRLADGAWLRSLQPSDATKVDAWWEYRSAKSLPLVQRRINLDLQQESGGACCLGIEVKGKLVASIVRYEGGALGMIYVEEGFRRRGYAKMLLEQATRALEQRGEERVAFIVDGNHASERLFLSAGWEREDPNKKRGTGKRRAKRKWLHKDATTQ